MGVVMVDGATIQLSNVMPRTGSSMPLTRSWFLAILPSFLVDVAVADRKFYALVAAVTDAALGCDFLSDVHFCPD
jgi:hypothetical protein